MKKVMYVLTVIFAVVLMSTSCTKPTDDVIDTPTTKASVNTNDSPTAATTTTSNTNTSTPAVSVTTPVVTTPAVTAPIPVATLSGQYPQWKNLTWVSTNGASSDTTYPKMNIKIISDNGVEKINVEERMGPIVLPYDPLDYTDNFELVSGNTTTITFTNPSDGHSDPAVVTGTYVINGSQVTFTTTGLSSGMPLTDQPYVFIMKIN